MRPSLGRFRCRLRRPDSPHVRSQTTGGYPQLAMVITADLPITDSLAPGDWIEFRCARDQEAMSALVAQEAGHSSTVKPRSMSRIGEPLASLGTLGVGGAARWLVHATMPTTWPRASVERISGIPCSCSAVAAISSSPTRVSDGLVLCRSDCSPRDLRVTGRHARDRWRRRGLGRGLSATLRRAWAVRARMSVGYSRYRWRYADSNVGAYGQEVANATIASRSTTA